MLVLNFKNAAGGRAVALVGDGALLGIIAESESHIEMTLPASPDLGSFFEETNGLLASLVRLLPAILSIFLVEHQKKKRFLLLT